MEDGQYAALADYLKKGVYPNGFSKGQKYCSYSLRGAAKSYKLLHSLLQRELSMFLAVKSKTPTVYSYSYMWYVYYCMKKYMYSLILAYNNIYGTL